MQVNEVCIYIGGKYKTDCSTLEFLMPLVLFASLTHEPFSHTHADNVPAPIILHGGWIHTWVGAGCVCVWGGGGWGEGGELFKI